MDIKEKQSLFSLFAVLLIFILIVIIGFYNIFVKNNFKVAKLVECDPNIDSCFVSDCDKNDSECDSTPYKKISVTSRMAGSDFETLTCSSNTIDCKITTCDEQILEPGEKCFK